ncbi:MAG: amidohydrolase family protein [Myxococcota bacterium]
MADLPFLCFDADNHYYESLDAFTRHLEPGFEKRCMQWAEMGGRTRLLVGGRLNRFIPNPTFDPVARPGCLDEFFRGKNPGAADLRTLFGELEPISPAYRERDARLALMDEQGIEKAFMFPTLGVGMEEALRDDLPAQRAAFRAFNRWLEEDWGFQYRDRIFATPYITLSDVDEAVAELEWALERGCRAVCMVAGPVVTDTGTRSPADPVFDPFWSRLGEAGITLAYHGGDNGYEKHMADWGESAGLQAFKGSPLKTVMLGNRAPFDTMAALICHGLFARHGNLRVASIEQGSNWVPWLLQSLRRVHGQDPRSFAEDPVETFKRHVWVSPFHEDDVPLLRELVGADHMLMGSDFPHAEGLAVPSDYVLELDGFSDAEKRMVMRDNALALSRPRAA